MKHGKKPTLRQKKLMQAYGHNSDDWLVVKDTPEIMVIKDRHTEKTIIDIRKELYK